MDPNYPYHSQSSSTGQMGGHYPTASAAPTGAGAGPTGGDFQQQEPHQPGYGDPQAAPLILYAGPQTAPQPGPYNPYGGPQTGYGSSQGGSQVDHSYQQGYYQPQAYQRGYGDDLEPYNFRTGLRPGVAPSVYNTSPLNQPGYPQQHGAPPPGHGGQYVPPPSTGQTAPSVAATNEPANPGTSGGFGAQGPQASGGEIRPGYPKENVRAEWSLRSRWIYDAGMLVDGVYYTRPQFYGDYNRLWKNLAVADHELWREFLDLRFEYLGY